MPDCFRRGPALVFDMRSSRTARPSPIMLEGEERDAVAALHTHALSLILAERANLAWRAAIAAAAIVVVGCLVVYAEISK